MCSLALLTLWGLSRDETKFGIDVAQFILVLWTLFYVGKTISKKDQISFISEFLKNEYFERKAAFRNNNSEPVWGSISTEREKYEEYIYARRNDEENYGMDVYVNQTLKGCLAGDEKEPENRFAWELSVALDHVGMAILMGAIPPSYVFAISSRQIVRDWRLSGDLIECLRNQQIGYRKDRISLADRRVYAQWLACASIIFLKSISLEGSSDFANITGVDISDFVELKLVGDSFDEVIKMEKEIRRLARQKDLVGFWTNRTIQDLLYGSAWDSFWRTH